MPDLDQTLKQLWRVLDNHERQQHYNYTSASIAAPHDAKLYILFIHICDSVPPEVYRDLIQSQIQFLKHLDQAITAELDRYGERSGTASGASRSKRRRVLPN